jgi:hypothetical protein
MVIGQDKLLTALVIEVKDELSILAIPVSKQDVDSLLKV